MTLQAKINHRLIGQALTNVKHPLAFAVLAQ